MPFSFWYIKYSSPNWLPSVPALSVVLTEVFVLVPFARIPLGLCSAMFGRIEGGGRVWAELVDEDYC